MINPYKNVNWQTVRKIQSLSHAHSHSQEYNVAFKSIKSWYEDGIRHFPYSNYYPSHPSYPILDDPYWSRGVAEDYDLLQNWLEENNITDIIEGPNAEHHTILNDAGQSMSRLHMNGLGSFFSSGNPPNIDPIGCQISWKKLIDNVVENLQFVDSGGVTINHPTWTNQASNPCLSDSVICNMLDYDERVLGIEIYNHPTFDLDLFDRILKTGRRCWGFCSPDHAFPGYNQELGSAGRNVLLIPNNVSETDLEHDYLKAYREGRFFGKLYGKHPTIPDDPGLKFDEISFNESNKILHVETMYSDEIVFVTDLGRQISNLQSVDFQVPFNAKYVRVQANGLGDMIFSNPIIIKQRYNHVNDADDIPLFFD